MKRSAAKPTPESQDPVATLNTTCRNRPPHGPGRRQGRGLLAPLVDSLRRWFGPPADSADSETSAVGRLDEIASLFEMAALLSADEDASRPLDLACQHLVEEPGADLAAVFLSDSANPKLLCKAARGSRSGLAMRLELQSDEGAIGPMIQHERARLIDLRNTPRATPGERALAELGLLAVAPVRTQERNAGLLLVGGSSQLTAADPFLIALGRLGESLGGALAGFDRQHQARARFQDLERVNREIVGHQRESEIFLATAIHELRTPLSGIVSYSEVLADYYDTLSDDERRSFCSTLNQQCKTIMGLVDQLFDFTRLESGKLTLDSESVQINELVRSAIDLMSPVAADRGLRLKGQLSALGPVVLDPTKVRQCVLNLLSNAMKFTPEGGTITVRLSADAHGVEILVSDTGRGIPREELDRIFDLFHSGSTRTTGKSLGLGLYLVKSFVELHGGEMSVESQPGEGSTFGFTLPWEPPDLNAEHELTDRVA